MFEGWSFVSRYFEGGEDQNEEDLNAVDAGVVQSGLLAPTLVASSRGWVRVGDLKAGDMVLTFDAGLQPVTKVAKEPLWGRASACPKAFWPLEVPVGAFGNRKTMRLLSDQSIMVESDKAEDLYGDPFTLIPASALLGLNGIERVVPGEALEVVHVHFEQEQVVFGEHGTLYLCPSSRDMVDMVFETAIDPIYSILPMNEARQVALSLEAGAQFFSEESPQDVMESAYA